MVNFVKEITHDVVVYFSVYCTVVMNYKTQMKSSRKHYAILSLILLRKLHMTLYTFINGILYSSYAHMV